MAIPIDKKKVDAINAKINPTATVKPRVLSANELRAKNTGTNIANVANNVLKNNTVNQAPVDMGTVANNVLNKEVQRIQNAPEVDPTQLSKEQLKQKIATGNFTAQEAGLYNRMTQDQQGARNVAITSPEALNSGNLTTQLSQEEAERMKASGLTGNTKVSTGITTEAKPGDVSSATEQPKYQAQLDKFLETGDIESARNKLKEGLANGSIDKNTYNVSEAYLAQKNLEQSKIAQDENLMYKSLVNGEKIQDEFTYYPEAIRAKARFDVTSKYLGMTENQLLNAYNNGEINQKLENDLITNPYLQSAKEKHNKQLITDDINKEGETILTAYKKGTGETITTKTEEKTVLEKINDRLVSQLENMGKSEDEILSFKDYMAENHPELVTQVTELNAKNMEIKKLTDERDDRLDNIIKENPGISINRAVMLAARDNKDINKQIQSMSYEIANLSANVQYQTSLADKEYGYQLQAQSRQDQLLAEQRGYTFDLLKTLQGQDFSTQQQDTAYNRDLEAEQRQNEFATQRDDINYQRGLEAEQRQRDFAVQQQELQMKYENFKDIQNYEQDLQKMGFQNAMAIDMNNLNFEQQKELNAINQKYQNSQNVQNYNQDIANWNKLDDNTLYNQKTGETKAIKNTVVPDGYYTQFPVTQNAGDKSPNTKDTGYKGGTPGLDFAMPKGTEVISTTGGTVISAESNKDYGTQVVIEDSQGNQHMYSHLSTGLVSVGNTIQPGQVIAKSGNTGFSTGPHLDYRVKGSDGKWQDPAEFIAGEQPITQTDIFTFNSSTFKPQKDLETPLDKAKYAKFLEEKTNIMKDKEADIYDILAYSAGGKDLTDSPIKELDKYDSALSQLSTIQEQISKMDTGPVIGRLKNINPYDTDAQVLKAQLTALIPNLARGVYGEVGVLTDNDIRLYSQTIPNLTQTNNVNNAVLAMTLKVLAGGYKRKLQSLAAAGKDVSGFAGLYENVIGQVNSIEQNLGMSGEQNSGTNTKTNIQDRLNQLRGLNN